MYLVYGYAQLFFPHSSSLKEKRKVIHSIIARIRKRFNVSISEVEHQDLWQRSTIGFSAIGSDYPELQLITNAVKETFYNYAGDVEIIALKHEIQKIDMTS
ncbi:MAG: DUF503 domain-containing protein [Syntrophomonas sp.]|uniref:DUF503 domain-containing protein n=1 Tax=Syntrophomonas sp. TaxID=2053627 RepID=UPI0026217E3B|nr:DUF503 domain-containing protein [Syntrophomonas sp.]MDD2509793.1 DUF503 domain-containing protein [Syntrophomonas sp.]MDD3878901.1 DUF503 domain-containing protein [Syntrophomonas sp.]MDD4625714.1 DUF503 domain-containing protein [Syntrophomonas sp.]